MSWAKVDDRANEHPKQLKAGPKACWLWACGLMYCNRQAKKTGRIPKTVVHSGMLFPGLGAKDAQKLIEADLWSDDGDSYVVHEYERWNPEKKPQHEPGSLSEKRANAGRLGGKRSGEVRSNREANHEASLLHAMEANEAIAPKQGASSRTAAPAYAHSRALDPPHPTPPQSPPDGGESARDPAAIQMSRTWDPGFGLFVGTAVSEQAYLESLERFREYHLESSDTPDGWRKRLRLWVMKDHQQGNSLRKAASKEPETRQPNAGFDFSRYERKPKEVTQ